MSDVITGSIDNGSVGEATIGSYSGPVGISRVAGVDTVHLAFRGGMQTRRPATGTLDGQTVEIIALRRSDFDRQLQVATVRLP